MPFLNKSMPTRIGEVKHGHGKHGIYIHCIVPCLARNRAHTADMIREPWPTIIVLCFTATASGSLVLLESR